MNEIIYDGMDLDAIKSPEELINPFEGHTAFAEVYNRFLGKITDDMYMELTPEDTIRDLKNLLINAIPGFEFPKQVIDDYVDCVEEKSVEDLLPVDFVIGEVESGRVLIERSYFVSKLTSEEINIFPNLHNSCVRIDTTHAYELHILKPYLEKYLTEVSRDSRYYEQAQKILEKLCGIHGADSAWIGKNSLYKEFV